jgi:hypothetical protein
VRSRRGVVPGFPWYFETKARVAAGGTQRPRHGGSPCHRVTGQDLPEIFPPGRKRDRAGHRLPGYKTGEIMERWRFDVTLVTIVVVALIAGCAGLNTGPSVAPPTTSPGDLSGTWNGFFWALGGFYYPIEGTLLLQIKEDGTFTAAMRPTPGANNIAKASSWSGTIGQRGPHVVFHFSQGQLPVWSSLARSADTMYGVAKDPATGSGIGIMLERTRGGA